MIVDFAMPEMSGTEFLKECARDPMLAGIPVIVTSAMRPADMIAQGLERYLQKPFRPDTLLQQLAALLKGPS
jgi:CheY-like chemotaxis protein